MLITYRLKIFYSRLIISPICKSYVCFCSAFLCCGHFFHCTFFSFLIFTGLVSTSLTSRPPKIDSGGFGLSLSVRNIVLLPLIRSSAGGFSSVGFISRSRSAFAFFARPRDINLLVFLGLRNFSLASPFPLG